MAYKKNLDMQKIAESAKKSRSVTLNVYEVAAILNIHPQTVTRLAREGNLPATKAGAGRWYFSREAIYKKFGISEG